jgi:hypothetical protein
LADGHPKQAFQGDTVWVFPVVRAVAGETHDTVCLANTARIRCVIQGRDSLRLGWPLRERLNIWSRLKDGFGIKWFELLPAKPRFGRNEPIRYRLKEWGHHQFSGRKPVASPGINWYQELCDTQGLRRLVVQVSYGAQSCMSADLRSDATRREAEVSCVPWICFRTDTSAVGWATGLLRALPYREGSTIVQTREFVSCDNRSLILGYLARLGHQFSSQPSPREIDSAGQVVFKGYVRRGRLYDDKGRPARLVPGKDLRRGDVVHFTSRGLYAIVAKDLAGSSWPWDGIPARLPVLGAFGRSPEVKSFPAVLWSLRTFFARSDFTVLRYPPFAPVPQKNLPAKRKPAPEGGVKHKDTKTQRHHRTKS